MANNAELIKQCEERAQQEISLWLLKVKRKLKR